MAFGFGFWSIGSGGSSNYPPDNILSILEDIIGGNTELTAGDMSNRELTICLYEILGVNSGYPLFETLAIMKSIIGGGESITNGDMKDSNLDLTFKQVL